MSHMNEAQKRRYDRLAKQRQRGSKRSYVTEVENLQIITAWAGGALSEGQALKALGVIRIDARDMKITAMRAGCHLAERALIEQPQPKKAKDK